MSARLSDHLNNNEDIHNNMFEDIMTYNKKMKSREITKNEFSGDYYNNIYDTRQTVDNNNDFNLISSQYTDNNNCYNDPSYYYSPNINDNYINDMAFLHPKDTSGYTSMFPIYPNNDWSRLSYSPTYSNSSNSTISPKSQDSSQITPNYDSNVFITVDLHEVLFNRLQWYHITCKFENSSGLPMFAGYNVVLDQSVQFVDGRRRPSTVKPFKRLDDENTIYISAIGTCASTGSMLKKCKRCKEKDKSLRKRKRKREENEIWNELDEENNNKLIQLFSSGENVIDENGELKFRIRIGCCVGVSKQHHINHVKYDGGKETLEIHKACEGLLLSLKAVLPNDSTINCHYSQPIRILGKVTEADKQKFSPDYKFLEKVETFKPISKHSVESDIEDVGNIFQSRRSFIGCSSCAAKGDRELFSKVDPSKVKPSVLLQHFATTFKTVFENVFTKRQINSICNDSFFANPPLESFTSDTPSMLQVYTILAVGACMSGYLDTADRFWERATKLANYLSEQPISEKNEVLLLADGLNRVSFYYGSGSDPEKGFYYSNKSYERLIHLSKTYPEVLNMDVYETALWSRVTYKMDKNILEEVKQWAIERKNLDFLSYVIFLQVITRIIPDLREFVRVKTKDTSDVVVEMDKKCSLDEFFYYFNELKDVFEKTGYKNYTCGNHKYSKLIEEGFGCIESWMKGDKVKGLEQARSAAIQCSLLEHPQFPSLIPTYFACIVCAKVAETKHPSSIPYIDYAELCIKSFSRVTHFRWVRIIADYFIKKIDVITGRCIEMNTCPLRDRNFDNFST